MVSEQTTVLESPAEEVVSGEAPLEGQSQEPAVDYKTEYERLAAERQEETERLRPLLAQWQADQAARVEEKARQDLQAAMTIADEIEKASDASDEPLSVEQRGRLKQLLEAGVQFEQEAGTIAQERVAASAIWYASRHIMADPAKAGVVQELIELGAELAKYHDPRLMRAHVQLLSQNRQALQTSQYALASRQRAASGVDSPPLSVTGTSNLQDGEAIGRKIATSGVNSLSTSEKKRYNEWRRANNLPGVSGW